MNGKHSAQAKNKLLVGRTPGQETERKRSTARGFVEHSSLTDDMQLRANSVGHAISLPGSRWGRYRHRCRAQRPGRRQDEIHHRL
jgi:hypothetical protein